MANVKGLVVQIGGDTSGLEQALKSASKGATQLQNELKDINKLLKFDPSNSTILAQKQQVLTEKVKETTKMLTALKEEQARYIKEGGDLNTPEYRKLQRQIEQTTKELEKLNYEQSGWKKASDTLMQFSDNLSKVSGKLSEIGTALMRNVTAPITALATAGVTLNANIEKTTKSFETFLGSSEAAEKAVAQIRQDVKGTVFDSSSLLKANQMLISTGKNAEESRETILALANAVTATGGGNDELVRMASNLQQISNAGKATSMDIRQFAYAGIDVYGILADYLGKTTQEIKEMDISFDDLSEALKKASKDGGKYFGALGSFSETLTGQLNSLKSEAQEGLMDLTKSLLPTIKKVVSQVRNVIKAFSNLNDTQKETILRIGLIAAAIGPALKLGSSVVGVVSNVAKGMGTLTKAIGLAKNGIGDATGAAANLAKVFKALASPTGLAIAAITAAIAALAIAVNKMNQSIKDAFSNIGQGASDFVNGIDTAQSHLDAFNTELFVSAEEQHELEEQMQEVQKGITAICKTAADERRGYTQEEIKQLDEYFEQLRKLNQRELEIQQNIAGAITQQAQQNAKSFEGTLEEYKAQSQEWIKTAEEQKNKTIALINNQTIEEVALLNTRYATEEARQSEAYQEEYSRIESQQKQKIALANEELAKINQSYLEGYTIRGQQEEGFYQKLKEYATKDIRIHGQYSEDLEATTLLIKKNWTEMYKSMDESEEKQLGTWLAMVAETEMYGGQISASTSQMVDEVLASMEVMPDETKKQMQQTMAGMLEGMQSKEPVLYAKATGIAEGILSRLKSAFDIHSPSKETKEIFANVMKGAEEGLDSEKNRLNQEIDQITQGLKLKLASLNPSMRDIDNLMIERNRTIYTTPNIVFNVQELDKQRLEQCFNYVNLKFGSQY